MYRYLTIKRIGHIAWKTVQDAGIKGPKVDLTAIINHLGMELKKEDFGDDISGLLILKEGKAIIGINENHHANRQNFSIAHEIGHYVLGHERNGMFIDKHRQHFSLFYRNTLSSEGTDQQEMEANAFAAALLMPEKFLRAEIERLIKEEKNSPFDLSGGIQEDLVEFLADDYNPFIANLANTFGVSSMAMTYRIGNLNLFETM